MTPADCQSGVCTGDVCSAASCSDGIKNGSETDIDCGGSCAPCAPEGSCDRDGDCQFGCGANRSCRHAASCSAILAASPGSRDGVFLIDPDGNGASAAFPVYCDMTTQGGGWMLVGKLGDQLSHYFSTLFDVDLNASQLLDGDEPTSTQYAHWDLNRFNSYGSTWAVRVKVDSGVPLPSGTGTIHQYAYYRPRGGMKCLPGTAGTNWLGTTTPSLLEHRTGNHTSWSSNTTWLPLGPYQSAGATLWLFGYRDAGAGIVDCLDGNGQTKLCHAPPGPVHNELNLLGTYTGAYGIGDQVPHEHGKRATYWLRNAREP
ncbi:MAG: hypothetical protein E6J90_47355 [Deltaproteobacteria bacterium]|nr:MAG: hypothetical protein E6J90_47355 [Deltaproteobacteria bacterium]TMQ18400.1 MAG: hypothetical protein E6J91_07900 [Deltaproteobacteria bacterium]